LYAIIQAAGWPIWFLIVASIVAVAIIGERWWSLRESVVMPRNLLARVVQDYRQNGVTPQMLSRLASGSPLGRVFAAGLRNARSPTPIVKEAIEEAGRAVAIDLERFLTSLGTIAAISPLLGLFGAPWSA
jgi:biopolymer transport protein ExbB